MQFTFPVPGILLVLAVLLFIGAIYAIRKLDDESGAVIGTFGILGSLALVIFSIVWFAQGHNPFADTPEPETQWTVLYQQCADLDYNETRVMMIKNFITSGHPEKTLTPKLLERFQTMIRRCRNSSSSVDQSIIEELVPMMSPYLAIPAVPAPTSCPTSMPAEGVLAR